MTADETAKEDATAPSEIPEVLWSQFTPRIKTGIISEYLKLPRRSTNEADKNVDWMRAFLLYTNAMERPAQGHGSWVRDNITGLMVISALMALAFGVLGALGISADGPTKAATSGFLDIAKLFAGALVGAAGATAIVKR